ncbi:hypothetical protein F5876DRAFT_80385 [Lentinula aff. lateritia]|uniref:Uncharacterized protein n=1 Tax=Lentinula aff. lateritia TaxID=2804960 RepID=A0ACC1TPP6_9AGAR|nr:hypothetical protein F5876DRAFT_80385 [Lentinula aff. lateritia]
MDENFDAYTFETRVPLTETAGAINQITRTTSWAPTSPPLDEDFDAWTYTNTAGPVTGTGTIYEEDLDQPDSEEGEQDERRSGERGYDGSESQGGNKNRLRRRSVRKLGRKYSLTLSPSRASRSEGFWIKNGYHSAQQNGRGTRPHYDPERRIENHYEVNEMPSLIGNNDWNLDLNRKEVDEQNLSWIPERDGPGPNHRKVTRSHTGASRTRNENGQFQGESVKKKDSTRSGWQKDHIHQTISRKGPVANDYEVVENRVLEDGPERTVTISTWREKVANESKRSEVEMSVYYLNADDYIMDPGIEKTRRREDFRDSLNGQGGTSRSGRKRKGKQRDLLDDGWTRSDHSGLPVAPLSQPVYYRSASPVRPQTPWPSNTNLADVDGEASRQSILGTTDRSVHGGLRRRSSYTEWMDREYLKPRTSTPVRHRTLEPNEIRGSEASLRTSTTAREALSYKPKATTNGAGHPSGSSSTISSMQVASTPALEALLSSCEPSLLYLAPVLVGLGIKTKEHMKAVGKLREETRNREVREEALKRGMTIMEWAILLDKLQQNG